MKRFTIMFMLACTQASLAQLSGPLSGTLGPGEFHVVDTIYVDEGDSLRLMPGTIFIFDWHCPFLIYGTLQAEGMEGDTIIFTADPETHPNRWRGLIFSDSSSSNSHLEFCLMENSCPGYWLYDYGSGAKCYNASPTFIHCTFRDNSGGDLGGGAYCDSASPTFSYCTFENNYGYYGGGVACQYSSFPTFTNCTFSYNTTGLPGIGGGVVCLYNSSPTFDSCTISHNYAEGGGGVGCWDNCSPTFTNCTIANNAVIEMAGGGVGCWVYSSPTFVNCTINGNRASDGGGISCYENCSAILTNCTINGNSASYGGGVFCGGASPIFTNCTINGNTSSGVYCAHYSSAIFANCTLSENLGMGVYCYRDESVFSSTIIAFSNGGGVFFRESPSSLFQYCDVFGNSSGNIVFFNDDSSHGSPGIAELSMTNANDDSCDSYFNILLDPMFADTAAGDYHLLASSPCIDAGDPVFLPDPDGTVAEIGAFHFPQEPPPFSFHVSPDTLDFDSVIYRHDSALTFWIHNLSENILHTVNIRATDTTVFHANPVTVQILPSDSSEIELTFTPRRNISYLDSVRIAFAGLRDVEMVVVQGMGIYDCHVLDGAVNGRLSVDCNPYYVPCSLKIEQNGILEIDPGVELIFDSSCPFEIYGLLLAQGTSRDSIIFTCDTLHNPDRWQGIRFLSDHDSCQMMYCVIEYGKAEVGGGVYSEHASTTFDHCTIRDNFASYGGGVYCQYGSSTFTYCVFSDNSAGTCGGVYCNYNPLASFSNCIFRRNTASGRGGGLHCRHSSATFASCTIIGNSTGDDGGGMSCYSSSPTFTNCTFIGNSAVDDGGGAFCRQSSPSFVNCTFGGNSTDDYGGGIYCVENSSPIFNSTIIAFSVDAGIYFGDGGGSRIEYCNFFGNSGGAFTGQVPENLGVIVTTNANGDSCDTYFNIFLDPMFVDTAAGDFHLLTGSPSIDAGDPLLPLDPDSTTADIGAFYFHQLGADESVAILPITYALHPNWPNPFNPTTNIRYDVPQAGHIRVVIYNLLGQEVTRLVDRQQMPGSYAVSWNATNWPSGLYFCRMTAPGFMQIRKLMLVK